MYKDASESEIIIREAASQQRKMSRMKVFLVVKSVKLGLIKLRTLLDSAVAILELMEIVIEYWIINYYRL